METPVRNAPAPAPELIDRARRMAWKVHRKRLDPNVDPRPLGRGHFSQVFPLAEGVLKVGGPGGYGYGGRGLEDPDTGVPVDDAWPAYIEWTAKLKRRPSWAPRVYHLEFLTPRVYFAVMERLAPNFIYVNRNSASVRVPAGILADMASKRGYLDDLHDGNFMLRGRQPVVTDPWCVRTC